MFNSAASLAEALHRVAEGSHSFQERADLEHWLLKQLRDQGPDALAGVLVDVEGLGFSFTRTDEPEGRTRWESPIAPGDRKLVVTSHVSEDLASLSVDVESPDAATTPDPRHQRFYAMWEDLMALDDGEAASLEPPRRAVYVTALLEAEVMNGGLGQYAANTGCVHLRDTLQVLHETGASATRGVLQRLADLAEPYQDMNALWEEKAGDLDALTEAYLATGEDLAGAVMDRFFPGVEGPAPA